MFSNIIDYNDISPKFEGNFYLNFNDCYYIFEGFGYTGLNDNINLNEYKFLKNCKAIIEIFKESDNKVIDKQEFDFNNFKKNYIKIKLNYDLLQDFKINIIIKYFNKEVIYNKYISFKDIINKYEKNFKNNIDTNISRIIPVILDLNEHIDFTKIFCFNCTHEDMINSNKKFKNNNFYSIHKINKILNFKFLDYKIYSSFIKNRQFKENDIIIYTTHYNKNSEYYFDYRLLNYNEINFVLNFYYKTINILSKLNYKSSIDKYYNIDNDKRKFAFYVQEFKKIQSKNFFQIAIQQNLKNIV